MKIVPEKAKHQALHVFQPAHRPKASQEEPIQVEQSDLSHSKCSIVTLLQIHSKFLPHW